MKKLNIILVILALFIIFPVATFAVEDSEAETVTDTELTTTENQETIEAREERAEKAKKTYPIRLNEKEQKRLASRCVRAQEKLTKVADVLDIRSQIISKKYDLIELHLVAVQKRLTSQQIDTSIVDVLIANFQKLTTEYDTALLNYQNALGDASAVDCATEPETFKALLEEVRARRQEFVNSVEAIKDFTKGELKTSFDALRARLKSRDEEQ